MHPAPPSGAPVRLTLAGEDVELERGARLGALRPRLAEALGRSELLGAPLAVGPRQLDDDALVGFGPLVAGADVRVHAPGRRRPGTDDDPVRVARAALAAPARWEVVDGPHAGRVVTDVAAATGGRLVTAGPVARSARGGAHDDGAVRTVRVRRAASARASWSLTSAPRTSSTPTPSARASSVRTPSVRPTSAPAVSSPAVSSPASHGRPSRERATLVRERRRGRTVRLGLLGRRVRHGDVVRVGQAAARRVVPDVASTRAAVHVASGPAGSGPGPDLAAADRQPTDARGASRGLGPGTSATTLVVPVVSAGLLAVVTGRPAFALVGLVGPLVLGVAALARRVRREPPPEVLPRATWDALAGAPVALTTRIVTGTTAGEAGDGDVTHGPRALVATGPRATARARAAVLAFAALRPGAPVTTVGGEPGAWEWARWLGARPGREPDDTAAPPGTPRLVVVTATAPADVRRASEWWARADAGTHVVLVAPAVPASAAPAWCEGHVDGPGVGADLADALARELAPHVERAAGAAHAPTVPLADLVGLDPASPGPALARAVADRWTVAPQRLLAPVGRLADGSGAPWHLDLVRDGPHGLVAGTTGAGKSELLQTLVLSLALTHPPARLSLVLVDHKGGAGFGPCLTLPHVAGVATDLEPGSARRALAALRAELVAREELLARHGVADVDTLAARVPHARLPRLVVVVDELRALADDDPELVPSFLRIAAQGRSLGLHLVLATQRPAGTVSADVRANVGLRVALRVASDADSRDVVGSADAAALPASAPGLAVVVTSRSPQRTVRVALASAPSTPASARVRRVPRTPGPPRAAAPAWGDDVAARLVAAACEAAELAGTPRTTPLWEPPLPERCTTADGPAPVPSVPDALPVALLDEPDARRRATAVWTPARGHLHVEGGPGSGRSTVLRALALEAAGRGWHVHVLGPHPLVGVAGPAGDGPAGDAPDGPLGPPSDDRAPAWCGTHAPASDPRRAHALVARLLAAQPPAPTLVLVDGVEEMLAALGRVARGAGADALVALARQPTTHGVHLALASARALSGPLAASLGPRLVLTGSDRAGDLARGVPAPLAGLGGTPGRGVWTGAGPSRLAQAFVPRPTLPPDGPRGEPGPVRLRPVPVVAGPAARAALRAAVRDAPRPGLAPVGHGGDDAGPRLLDVTRDVLVVGPPGSGRSTLLARLARHAAGLGPVLVVGRCLAHDAGPGRDDAPAAGRVVTVPVTPDGLVRAAEAVADGGWTLVVDDADVLARLLPAEHDRLGTLPGVTSCLVAATTGAATLASRGLLGRARTGRHGVVLDPGRPGSADVLATELAGLVEPGPCPPGRGALVVDGRAELVQTLPPDADGTDDAAT